MISVLKIKTTDFWSWQQKKSSHSIHVVLTRVSFISSQKESMVIRSQAIKSSSKMKKNLSKIQDCRIVSTETHEVYELSLFWIGCINIITNKHY